MTRSDIWQNANGSWSHHKDSKREWADRVACATDLRFTMEWEAKPVLDEKRRTALFGNYPAPRKRID